MVRIIVHGQNITHDFGNLIFECERYQRVHVILQLAPMICISLCRYRYRIGAVASKCYHTHQVYMTIIMWCSKLNSIITIPNEFLIICNNRNLINGANSNIDKNVEILRKAGSTLHPEILCFIVYWSIPIMYTLSGLCPPTPSERRDWAFFPRGCSQNGDIPGLLYVCRITAHRERVEGALSQRADGVGRTSAYYIGRNQ